MGTLPSQPRDTQPLLFEMSDSKKSAFKDTAFAQNKKSPVHRWVPWIAGFSASFVRDVLNRYLSSPGIVLDPFCGVGTTLIEATLLGHTSIGFEINPYAAFVCNTKLNIPQVNIPQLQEAISRFETFYNEHLLSPIPPVSSPPKNFRTRSPFYSPKVLRKVLIFFDYIRTLDNYLLRDIFKLAFASTMIQYSNYSYEPSLGRRSSAGKPDIQDFPVGKVITHKVQEILQDILWFNAQITEKTVNAQVLSTSFFNYPDYLKPNSVDLIITSPPYLNNYHYNRNTRPQLYWLGFVKEPRDLKALEQAHFGKYWQTVRNAGRIDLHFSLPNSDLAERLESLRAINPSRGIYGGHGWANYAASYFNDCYALAKGIYNVLKPGGRAIIVLGNSILQGIPFPTDQYFASIAESVGLRVIQISTPRATRVGNSIIHSEVRAAKAKKHLRLYESIIEILKT